MNILISSGSRDSATVATENRVTVYFVVHLYDIADLVGSTLTIGITLEVDTSTIWVGNSDVTVDAATTTGLVRRIKENRI